MSSLLPEQRRVAGHRLATDLWARVAAAVEADGPAAAQPLLEEGIESGLGRELVAAGLADGAASWAGADAEAVTARALGRLPTALAPLARPVLVAVVGAMCSGIDESVSAHELALRVGVEDALGALALVSSALSERLGDVLSATDDTDFWDRR